MLKKKLLSIFVLLNFFVLGNLFCASLRTGVEMEVYRGEKSDFFSFDIGGRTKVIPIDYNDDSFKEMWIIWNEEIAGMDLAERAEKVVLTDLQVVALSDVLLDSIVSSEDEFKRLYRLAACSLYLSYSSFDTRTLRRILNYMDAETKPGRIFNEIRCYINMLIIEFKGLNSR